MMSTNVVVCCRFRPANKNETSANSKLIAAVTDNSVAIQVDNPSLLDDSTGGTATNTSLPSFNFDAVFDWNSAQSAVYARTGAAFVKDIFAGFNCTVFAYGQTGSGKTHTMMGGSSDESKGIIPRLVQSVFAGIERAESGIDFTVKLSFVEIYNEKIRDLLNMKSGDNLKIRESARGVYIEGVTETYVSSYEHVLSVMNEGTANRAVSATKMNAESSRSHSVFILTLGQLNTVTGSKKGSKLTLVDLAGSEKVGKTGAAGSVLDEAKHINKSLSALGNVINALSAEKSGAHIPYRDSKLTRLLSDSLGGNSKTCLIITCSPMSYNVEETLSTLRFGTRAKMIKNKAKANVEKSSAEYKKELQDALDRIVVCDSIIAALEKDIGALQAVLRNVPPEYLTSMPVMTAETVRKNAMNVAATADAAEAEADKEEYEEKQADDETHSPASARSSAPISPRAVDVSESASDEKDNGDGSANDLLQRDPSRLTALTLANAELQAKLSDAYAQRDLLQSQVSDVQTEFAEHREIVETEAELKILEMSRLSKELSDLQLQSDVFTLKESELDSLRKAVEAAERERTMSVLEWKEEKRAMQQRLNEAINEMNQQQSQMEQWREEQEEIQRTAIQNKEQQIMADLQRQRDSTPNTSTSATATPETLGTNANNFATPVKEKGDSSTNEAQTTPSTSSLSRYVKSSPLKDSVRAALGVNLSGDGSGMDLLTISAQSKRRRQRLSASANSSLKTPIRTAADVAQLTAALASADDQTKLIELTAALTRKSEELDQLQHSHTSTKEKLALIETLLADTQSRERDNADKSQRRIRELEQQKERTEQLCTKLIERLRQRKSQPNQSANEAAAAAAATVTANSTSASHGTVTPLRPAAQSKIVMPTPTTGGHSRAPSNLFGAIMNTSIVKNIRDDMSMFF